MAGASHRFLAESPDSCVGRSARILQGGADASRLVLEVDMSFIGIDVAKAQLEFAGRPSGDTGAVANDDAGIRALVAHCRALAPTLVVLEATGGYEAAVVAALATAGLPVVVANPRQVRDFAKATGQLAKADALDAQVLALFAERVRPTLRALPDDAVRALDALLTRRRQLVEMLTAERNRLLLARPPVRRDLSSTSVSSSAACGRRMLICRRP